MFPTCPYIYAPARNPKQLAERCMGNPEPASIVKIHRSSIDNPTTIGTHAKGARARKKHSAKLRITKLHHSMLLTMLSWRGVAQGPLEKRPQKTEKTPQHPEATRTVLQADPHLSIPEPRGPSPVRKPGLPAPQERCHCRLAFP